MSEVVCRCGRKSDDAWWCDHPAEKPLLCRMRLHNWSIYTEPIHVRWCYRCGQRSDR